jgi:type II secretory pathway pseudopilin PulG
MPPAARRAEAGFTLIEALVAFVILGLALGALLPRISLALTVTEDADAHARAVLLAESLIDAVGEEIPLEPGETDGVQDGFAWRVAIVPAAFVPCCARGGRASEPVAPLPVDLYDVTATVSRLRRGAALPISLWTEKLAPQPAGASR